MKVVIVGSGTLVPDGSRGASAHWIEAGSARVLLDCGPGTVRSLPRFGLDWPGVTHVLLTHFHIDHVAGLPGLLFALRHGVEGGRKATLTFIGPRGLRSHLQGLVGVYGSWILQPEYPLEVFELEAGETWEAPSGDFSLTTVETLHSDTSMGYALTAAEGRVGYTGDTGWDPSLGAFFRDCQLLIAECSHPDGEGLDNHLTPSQLAELASMASPDLLVPVHAYPGLDPDAIPGFLREAGYDGQVLPGRDGLSVDLQAGVVVTTEPKKP